MVAARLMIISASLIAGYALGATVSAQEGKVDATRSLGGYAGTWVRSDDVEELLGNKGRSLKTPAGEQIKVCPKIEIAIDEAPDDRTVAMAKSWIEAVKHSPIQATGHILLYEEDDEDPPRSSICVFTYCAGVTYVWFEVPNLGMLPLGLSFVPGATEERDHLFVEWMPDGRFRETNRAVTAYRRSQERNCSHTQGH